MKMQNETGIIPLKIYLLVRAEKSACVLVKRVLSLKTYFCARTWTFYAHVQRNSERRVIREGKIICKTDLRKMQGHQKKRQYQNYL